MNARRLDFCFRLKTVAFLAAFFLSIFAFSLFIWGIPPDRPNILLITVDTLRADRVSCYDDSFLNSGNKSEALKYFTRYKRDYAQNLSLKELEQLEALIKKCTY